MAIRHGALPSINHSGRVYQGLRSEILMDTMTSAMYRLLFMEFEKGSIAEAIRLGLMAFSSHVFLQWHDNPQSYPRLSETYRDCLRSLKSLSGVSSHIMLWLLMAGAISVFNDSDDDWLKPWLRANAQLCNVNSWAAMRDSMESFLWIGVVHDQPGKDVFESAMLRRPPELYVPDI
ncbi:hypothetical protein BDV28DRAFT_129564 [Aspergillus coremiiformis]|uniref:Fungal-specific transcription factor domain-containing protein n=1 Tax=Aspergillus coremiiformis TaxID=138285 RepID=A0A5N6ZBU9_9EURO|nr:hypothetical protein BDV28DRAFT_129564 [Aspergillus coremiiformis]